jgi:hypothetical protein
MSLILSNQAESRELKVYNNEGGARSRRTYENSKLNAENTEATEKGGENFAERASLARDLHLIRRRQDILKYFQKRIDRGPKHRA